MLIISTLLHELPLGNKVKLSACEHKWNFMYIDDAIDAVYALYLAVIRNHTFENEYLILPVQILAN